VPAGSPNGSNGHDASEATWGVPGQGVNLRRPALKLVTHHEVRHDVTRVEGDSVVIHHKARLVAPRTDAIKVFAPVNSGSLWECAGISADHTGRLGCSDESRLAAHDLAVELPIIVMRHANDATFARGVNGSCSVDVHPVCGE